LGAVPNETIDVSVTNTGGDEALMLYVQLVPLFKQAGWKVNDNLTTHLDFSISGVGIMVPKSLELPGGQTGRLTPALMALQAAFKAAGLDAVFMKSMRSDEVIEIVLGAKPTP
jgi:hypothetical protein